MSADLTNGGLTRKQADALFFIRWFAGRNEGASPSYREIADHLDLKSISGVHRLITALEERGRIRRLPQRARAIEIIRGV